jgi:formylmethanofuran dehydrogenase subunit B
MSEQARTVGITCLGCGLLCDDVTVTVAGDRASSLAPACHLGTAWLGTGNVPNHIRSGQRDVTFASAIADAAAIAVGARGRLLVYLAPGLTVEALKPAVAIADRLQAVVETDTGAFTAASILAGQRRGRAAATLGELRNRADLVLFWGTNPSRSHPRLVERLVEAPGTHAPQGRASRTVVSVAIADDGAGAGADVQLTLPPAGELASLSILRSIVSGAAAPSGADTALSGLAARLVAAKYVAIVAGGDEADAARPPQRAEGLIALAQALNGPTRAALFTLRGGDNRNGIESLLTWQTGYPFGVDYRGGVPSYLPDRRGIDDVSSVDAALLLGDWRTVPVSSVAALAGVPTVVIGPGASEAPGTPRIAIDTGRAGIHEGGTAYRMDDIPLPLAPALDGPRTAAMVLDALNDAVVDGLREAAA